MTISGRPKRALLAYCALAGRLNATGMGITQAMTPFFAEVCRGLSGDLFDAQKFANEVSAKFGFTITRLAALGLAEQLAEHGLLEEVSGHASKMTVYRYAANPAGTNQALTSSITETEVESILAAFVEAARTDDRLKHLDDSALQNAFLDRLLHVDSMRILSRREASISAKRTTATLILKPPQTDTVTDSAIQDELHLDFLVSQFLLDLRDTNPAAFDQVSNVAFANMAAEAIACFRETSSNSPLTGLTLYLDTPLLLDALGVNTEYAEYGQELLDAIQASGAKAAVFDHCINEAENTVGAQLAYLRSGINQVGWTTGTTARPALLAALLNNVGDRAEKRLGVAVHRDPEINLQRRALAQPIVGDIQATMDGAMQAWRNIDAKGHDQKSVWIMLAIRNSNEPCPRVCDAATLLLTRNTALVAIANRAWVTWLKGTTKHSHTHIDRWAPVAMSDKQFAGYLWARSGGGAGVAMSRARLLAHCSAAVRPRADVKAKAYNLVMELSGKDAADDVAALLEDREGGGALMRATRGDPEDLTAERLPFILEKVKLAAGEFAAEKVREEAARDREALLLAHVSEIDTATKNAREQAALVANAQAELDRQAYESEKRALRDSLDAHALAEETRRRGVLDAAFRKGCAVFICLRWGSAIFLVLGVLGATMLIEHKSPWGLVALGLATLAGIWFVPELLNRPFSAIAMAAVKALVRLRDPTIELPTAAPDFLHRRWTY